MPEIKAFFSKKILDFYKNCDNILTTKEKVSREKVTDCGLFMT